MKSLKTLTLLSLTLCLAFTSCKKDKDPPTVTVTGANPMSVSDGGTYTELGATAVNPDGTSAVVVTDGTVTTTTTGSHTISYSAENEYGTGTATRSVGVVIGQDNYVGTYSLTSDCGAGEFPLNGSQEGVALSTSDSLMFDNFFNLVGGTAIATISGSSIIFPSQTINSAAGDIIFDGTGTMNAAGTEMNVTFNYDSSAIPFIGGIGTCAATITKQ
ncbi:MAG: DUF5011 domain-containing protein [Flavobacteriales bacterium]|nr:DUF5011 domain-containing protein [Flavobacteriales bacterium]